MARERKEPDAEGCPFWVVTFGDAMSLLVTFFVMLVSFADFEEHALVDMLGALKGGLRAVPLPMATSSGRVHSQEEIDAMREEGESSASIVSEVPMLELPEETDENNIIRGSSPDYYLHLLDNGVSLVINQEAVFDYGTADLVSSSHEAWQVAAALMRSVKNEVRVTVTLPERIVVRLDEYSTPWGLGIEQSLTVQRVLSKANRGDFGQMSTSVRVVKRMPVGKPSSGSIELLYIGILELKMEGMPKKILRGTWQDVPEDETVKEQVDGQEG